MALYLKYRPQRFADVVGQDHIVSTLEKAAELGRIAHAYLFSGPRGTGKTSIARILAKHILMHGAHDEKLAEQIGQEVERGTLVDMIEIDAASTRGIDDIRELIEKIQFPPVVAKTKVYIIDEVHMLTKEAFNALLKTLEEPPEYAYFILATTELHKVPDTIQSRCQRYPFRRVRDEDIIVRLQYIVDQEKIKADRAALRLIAAHATGSFRDAIAFLDQLRSLPAVTPKEVEERTGTTAESVIEEIVGILDAGNIAAIPALVERLEEEGMPLERVIHALLQRMRANMQEAVRTGEDPRAYLRTLDVLLAGIKDLRLSPVPGLVLESTLITLCQGDGDAMPATKKLEKKQERTEKIKQPIAEEPAATKREEEPQRKPGIIEVDELTAANVRKHWNRVLTEVSPASVRMSLKNGTLNGVDGENVVVAFASAFHRDKVAETKASRTIEEILERIFRKPARLKCVLEEEVSAPQQPEPSTNLVEAAAEVFGTQ